MLLPIGVSQAKVTPNFGEVVIVSLSNKRLLFCCRPSP